ncbi:MAG: hypothetical protein MUE60_16575 [Candidatus Eisenbacteria bacterium]|nr:hypothetical protein [Candidatus Eisenbacteria bacterium]
MRAILTFRFPHWLRFRLPEDDREYQDAVNDGWKWRAALQDLDNWLRTTLKYGDDAGKWGDESVEALSAARGALHDKIAERGLDLWD